MTHDKMGIVPVAAGLLGLLALPAGVLSGAHAQGLTSDSATTDSGPATSRPSVLPATGYAPSGQELRVGGNLGGQITDSLPRAFATSATPRVAGVERNWTITPRLSITEQFSNRGDGQAGSTGRGAQFITTVLPSVAVNGSSRLVQADVFYAPSLSFYVPQGSQNRVSQNFNGRVLATLLPQTLFLDLRGSAAVQSASSGSTQSGFSNQGRGSLSQSASFSASPYAVHRFSTWGTGEIGGTISRTTQNALRQNGTPSANQQALNNLAATSNQNVTTTGGHLAFTTGEAFARYNGAALAQVTRYDGQGVLSGAYRDSVSLDSGYAITRTITALATVGYERIKYGGLSPTRIDDAVWNVGTRLQPGPQSSVTVRYGHKDGFNSAQVDASVQPTARTRIYARYSSGLTTQAELLQNALATSDLDSLGNPVDHATGAPLVPVGSFFGVQNSVTKTTLASLSGSLLLDRDTISATISSQTQKLVSAANALGQSQGNSSGMYGTVSWSHELRPNLSGSLFGQYGTSTSSGTAGSKQQSVTVSANLSYSLTKTIAGQLQYSYNKRFGTENSNSNTRNLFNSQNSDQSIVFVSMSKSF